MMDSNAVSPGAPEDAVAHAREAAFLHPNDAEAFARLGRACLEADRLAEAIEALQRSVRIEPENASARTDLGRAWLAAAEPEKALFHLRRAVELDPADASGARALIAVAVMPLGMHSHDAGGQDLPPVFVRTLFDQYADRFDAEMTGVLAYRAPEALRDLLIRVIGAPSAALDVLDLGCGTGLSGQAFRAFASTLIGVDLSPRMAAKARARGIYDRVVVGDMTRACVRGTHDNAALGVTPLGVHSHDAPSAFDLVLAVDALGYVGDLAPLFRAARDTLRARRREPQNLGPGAIDAAGSLGLGAPEGSARGAPGGRFAATVEEDPGAGFSLGPARRFRHSAAYVRRAAEAAGFDLLALETTELRRDRGNPVAGLLFVLARRD
jgi:predicted TPR repeat methyltransferase